MPSRTSRPSHSTYGPERPHRLAKADCVGPPQSRGDHAARAMGAGGLAVAARSERRCSQTAVISLAVAAKPGVRRHPEPDWATLVREMKRPGVSLMILLEKYQVVHPQGYGYSRYVLRLLSRARNTSVSAFPGSSTDNIEKVAGGLQGFESP
jgi:hypothetical protein